MKYITILCTVHGSLLKSGDKWYSLGKEINGSGKGFATIQKLWNGCYEIIKFRYLDSMTILGENFDVGE